MNVAALLSPPPQTFQRDDRAVPQLRVADEPGCPAQRVDILHLHGGETATLPERDSPRALSTAYPACKPRVGTCLRMVALMPTTRLAVLTSILQATFDVKFRLQTFLIVKVRGVTKTRRATNPQTTLFHQNNKTIPPRRVCFIKITKSFRQLPQATVCTTWPATAFHGRPSHSPIVKKNKALADVWFAPLNNLAQVVFGQLCWSLCGIVFSAGKKRE